MSDDEADPEILELLRQSLGLGRPAPDAPPDTKVLKSAEFIYNNSIDVAIDSQHTQAAARSILNLMQEKNYSTKTWSEHELHPKAKDESTLNFIFTMDLLNFSFWPDSSKSPRFAVEYKDKSWTGYWSLVAALQRALEEGIPITDSHFWQNEDEFTEDVFRTIFRSANGQEIPLLKERMQILQQAGHVLYEKYNCSFSKCIEAAGKSASGLVNLLVEEFDCFKDEAKFEGKTVRILKRAQILVADVWACFDGEAYGEFDDIDTITMFADYRIPQMLHTLGCLMFSPQLEYNIRSLTSLPAGESWEVQLRGCSIWCVELIRREMLRQQPELKINAILIDFFLYDTMKEKEAQGEEVIPHHRTRCIWY